MLKVIDKDITSIEEGLVVHQVNCIGKMGSGVAGQLRKKYPKIFSSYSSIVRDYIKNGEESPILGTVNIVIINDKLSIVNAFTQYFYGYDGKQYTDYNAIVNAFGRLKLVNYKNRPVYIPFNYGCGLGGGDWNVVDSIIEKVYPEVIVCKLPNT